MHQKEKHQVSLQPSCILHQLKGLSHDLTADASCRCICRMRPVDVLRVLEYASPRPKAVSDDGLRACPLGRVFRPCIMSVLLQDVQACLPIRQRASPCRPAPNNHMHS